VNPIVASDQGVLNWVGGSLQSSTTRVRIPSVGPSFNDLYSWVEGTEGSGWIHNSKISTTYGTDPAFVDFFDNQCDFRLFHRIAFILVKEEGLLVTL